jgi:glycosyltransferase involved in cell wall biosynthesis
MLTAIIELDNSNTQRYILLQYGIDAVQASTKEKMIYSNRLHKPLYNIATIINDFYVFVKNNPDWHLVIGANGTETNQLKELVSKLNLEEKVTFIGFVDATKNNEMYSKASIYVSIPSSDGTSVSLLEAMSADCIPVVSDLEVSHEWIVNGENGIIRNLEKNPFEAALQLNKDVCFKINQQKIRETALRSTTIKLFYQLYQSAIQDAN